jgi:hypothetical protein
MGELRDIKDRAPNKDLINNLESMLRDAKSGEIRSAVCICGWDNDSVSHNWVLDERNTRRRILSEIALLQHDFIVNIGFEEGNTVLFRAFEVE